MEKKSFNLCLKRQNQILSDYPGSALLNSFLRHFLLTTIIGSRMLLTAGSKRLLTIGSKKLIRIDTKYIGKYGWI